MSANPGQWTPIAQATGSAKKPYNVSYNSKQFGCSCPAWTKRKYARENCKHINRVLAVVNGGYDWSVKLLPEGERLMKITALLD